MSDPTWSLPWHYLASGPCLISGTNVRNVFEGQDNLIRILDSMSVEQAQRVLAPDQASSSGQEPPFFDEVLSIAQTASKRKYDWSEPWPSALEIRFRRMPAGHEADAVLGMKALILPWPLPGAATHAPALTTKVEAGHPDRYPALRVGSGASDDYDPGTDLFLDDYMHAVDTLVDTTAGRIRFKPRRKPDDEAKKAIEEEAGARATRAGRTPKPYPRSLRVTVHEWMRAILSRWAAFPADSTTPAFLHFNIGWEREVGSMAGEIVPGAAPPAFTPTATSTDEVADTMADTITATNTATDTDALLANDFLDEWPCGVFLEQ